ncbi:hypothetical protein PIB30_054929, partial [Stylosanthes scabra]|nr:hypothetical protein [Stylosanthes scabra]
MFVLQQQQIRKMHKAGGDGEQIWRKRGSREESRRRRRRQQQQQRRGRVREGGLGFACFGLLNGAFDDEGVVDGGRLG